MGDIGVLAQAPRVSISRPTSLMGDMQETIRLSPDGTEEPVSSVLQTNLGSDPCLFTACLLF